MKSWISGAVEGSVDEAVLRRLCHDAGLEVRLIKVCGGKAKLDRKLGAYNAAAQHGRWIVIRDLNSDADCGPALVAKLLPNPSKQMHFRIAKRSVEAWLLADRKGFSQFFSTPLARIPLQPELLEHPKKAVLQIVRRSRKRAIREDMIPREGSGAKEGPAYSSRLAEFAQTIWQPEHAAETSDSLRRCLLRLGA